MCVVECQNCGALQPNIPVGTIVMMCFDCVREVVAPAYSQPPKKTGFPKGWKFMKVFVYSDGTVYHKGVEQPLLKGTLDPTVIEPKIKKSKAQKAQEKQQALAELQKLKIALKKETRKTYAKKLESQIKRLQRQL